jgi:predicted nucleotidyltransferase
MRTSAPRLLPLFRSESQLETLGLLLLQPSREWTLDQLASVVDAPVSSVHRELQRAVKAGIVVRDDRQRPHRYHAARSSPAFEPLRALLEMTVGLPDRIRRALSKVDGVRNVAIHGSWAAGDARADSDIDLIVISDGDRRETQRAVRHVARQLGREMDLSVMTPDEYAELRAASNPFLEKIVRGPRIDVIGELDGTSPVHG